MSELELFAPRVRTSVPGCPTPVILDAIVQSALRFCEESRVWTASLSPIDVVAGVAEYALYGPLQSDVITPVFVRFEGASLTHTSIVDIGARNPSWQSESANRPTAYLLMTESILHLYPVPALSAPSSLSVTAELRPAQNATQLPDWMLSHHRAAIENGALSSLMSMPGRQWSNEKLSLIHARWFSYYVGQEKRKRLRGFTNTSARARLRRFV